MQNGQEEERVGGCVLYVEPSIRTRASLYIYLAGRTESRGVSVWCSALRQTKRIRTRVARAPVAYSLEKRHATLQAVHDLVAAARSQHLN